MSELIFLVERHPRRLRGEGAQAHHRTRPTPSELHEQLRDAVRCHFDDGMAPAVFGTFVREELLAVWGCRAISPQDLMGALSILGYRLTRQTGSHVRLTTRAQRAPLDHPDACSVAGWHPRISACRRRVALQLTRSGSRSACSSSPMLSRGCARPSEAPARWPPAPPIY